MSASPNCELDNGCFEGVRIYRPVFNKQKDKACYLFSYKCTYDRTCRVFIFAEKHDNKWIYIDKYYSHLIGNED